MIHLRNYSVGIRLGLGFGLIMVIMVFVVIIAVINIQFNIRRLDNIISYNNKKVILANMINNSVHIMNDALNHAFQDKQNTTQELELIRMLTAQATYEHALEELEKLENTEKGEQIIYSLKRAYFDMKNLIANISRLNFHSSNSFMLDEGTWETFRPSIKHIQQLCQELVSYQDELTNIEYAASINKYKQTLIIFITLSLGIFIFTMFTAITLTKSITKPMKKGVDIAKRLADGDYNLNIITEGKDEPGRLLLALKELGDRLKKAKETEHQLYESQKMETLGRLAGGIAHDFNNMLSIILGNAQLIKMNGSYFDEKIHKRCDAIENAVMRASGFVKQLLAFSKKQPLVLEPSDINRLINELSKLLHKMIGEDIEMKLELSSSLPMVNIDRSQFNQVILNLIVNARESMPHGGSILIETFLEDVKDDKDVLSDEIKSNKYVVISIKDTGTGIEKDIQDKIFEPFFTTKQSGTGLGLSVVYGIVKQHGGYIKLESDVNKGTTFKIYIPCIDEAGKIEQIEGIQNLNTIENGKMETILVIEDNEDLRNLTKEMLKTLGYNIIAANDGLEGIEVFTKNKDSIDLIILDCIMPKKNGNDVFAEIRMHKPNVPVIFITGNNPDRIQYSPMEDKKMEIIQKPCGIETLSKKVRKFLDSRAYN